VAINPLQWTHENVKKKKVCGNEDRRGRKTHRRRMKGLRLSERSDMEWGARKDAEIRDLLSSGSSEGEEKSPSETIKMTGSRKSRLPMMRAQTVDEFLEGSLKAMRIDEAMIQENGARRMNGGRRG
jgi:hypothetical protein